MLKNPKLYLALSLIPLIVIVKVLSHYPECIETYYSNGFYQWFSRLFRYVFGWLPFSFGDVFYTIASIYSIRWLILNWKRIIKDTKTWLIDVFSAITIIYFAFHLFWGMNYYRLPLHESLDLQADYTTEELINVTKLFIDKSNSLQLELAKIDTLEVIFPYSKKDILDLVPKGYDSLKTTYPHLEYYPKSIKTSLYSLPLTYMGFSGYLNPLTHEAQIDGLIPVYKFPTTASHEVAHQLGYAAENEANFIGSLAAINHPDIYFKYSGYTFALRHCLFELYNRDAETYKRLITTVNKGILKNYREVERFWDAYQNPLEPFFKESYNAFLQVNNQKDGMKSYNYVVALYVNFFNLQKP